MAVKSSEFYALAKALPAFSFIKKEPLEWVARENVQTYLNFYKINFSKTLEKVQHRFGRIKVAGYSVAMHHWLPEFTRGTVFIVHGYLDHVGVYQHIIRFLLQNDFAVVMFDNPGHGLSSGPRASINSFDEYANVLQHCLKVCQKHTPKPWHIIGQSTGGATILNYINRQQGKGGLKKIVLLAPLVRSYHWGLSRWGFYALKLFIKKTPRFFSASSHDTDFLKFLEKKDPLQARHLSLRWIEAKIQWMKKIKKFPVQGTPLLIIQGDQDKTIDWRYSTKRIKKKFPNSEVVIIPEARHQLVNELASYRSAIFQKILTYLLK